MEPASFLLDMVKQVPGLAAAIYLVRVFTAASREIVKDCHDAQVHALATYENNLNRQSNESARSEERIVQAITTQHLALSQGQSRLEMGMERICARFVETPKP